MLRTHKLAEQCDMLEPVPPRRSKMFLKWQMMCKQQPPPKVKPKPKERLHIWQKVDRVHELNKIEDYYWFYEEWDQINKRFIKKYYKTFPELLMETMHSYRVKRENFEIIEYARHMDDDDEMDAKAWMKSLRKYFWELPPGSNKPPWDDGRTPKSPDDSRKPPPIIERIGHPDRDNKKIEYFKDSWAHTLKKQSEWGDCEWFCFKMAANISKLEPHYPDFTGLLILGKRLRPELPPQPKPLICIEPDVIKKKVPAVAGPAALISPTYRFFVNKVGDQTTKTVLLENVGETVLFYTWERRPMQAIITTPNTIQGKHITECRAFSVMNGSGSILAGEHKTFTFRFKSDIPGVFLESWVVRIAPRLPRQWTLDPIFLKGVAFSDDKLQRLREKLSRVLYYREMMSGIDEFFVDSLDRAARASRPTEEIRNADYMYSSQAFHFIQANVQVEPPVYYVPSLYMKLEALARVVKDLEPPPPPPPPPPPAPAPPAAKGKAPPSKSTPAVTTPEPEPEPEPWKWDGSLKSISTGIELVIKERKRKKLRVQLEKLTEEVHIPPHQTALLHVAMYRILHDTTAHVGDVMEGVPDEFRQSLAQKLMEQYYEKYENERLQKAADFEAEREKNPEAMEAEMMERLLEQINLENPPLNEISLESQLGNQEMLEYCFKWLHILTEMRLFTCIGFNDYEEQVRYEHAHLMKLIDERVQELSPNTDETSRWDIFAFERAKQELVKEEKHLLKINS